jgi:hypothetical protein
MSSVRVSRSICKSISIHHFKTDIVYILYIYIIDGNRRPERIIQLGEFAVADLTFRLNLAAMHRSDQCLYSVQMRTAVR